MSDVSFAANTNIRLSGTEPFHKVVEYQTKTLGTVQKMKTSVFYKIFVYSMKTLRDSFDILLRDYGILQRGCSTKDIHRVELSSGYKHDEVKYGTG